MNNKKKVIIACLLGMVVSLGVGFAAFSTTLKINGSAKVSPNGDNFKVLFASSITSVTEYSTDDFDGVANPISLEPSKGTFIDNTTFSNDGVTFTEDGQSIDYVFYILNAGKYDAYITNLDIGKKTCTPGEDADASLAEAACNAMNLSVILGDPGSQISYTESTSIDGHVLAKGTWEQIIVRIAYPEGSTLVDGDLDVTWEDIKLFTAANPNEVPIVEEEKEEDEDGDGIQPLTYNNPEINYTFTLKSNEEMQKPEEDFTILLAYYDEEEWNRYSIGVRSTSNEVDGYHSVVDKSSVIPLVLSPSAPDPPAPAHACPYAWDSCSGTEPFVKISYSSEVSKLSINDSGYLNNDGSNFSWVTEYNRYFFDEVCWDEVPYDSDDECGYATEKPELVFNGYYPINTYGDDNSAVDSSKYLHYIFDIEKNSNNS